MPPEKESLQEFIERIAGLTAIAEKHGVTVDILVPHREILLMTISRCGLRATLEAKHQGKSFNLTLHEANPRGASGADFEGMIKAFIELDEPLLSSGKISSEPVAHQEASVEIDVLTKPKG